VAPVVTRINAQSELEVKEVEAGYARTQYEESNRPVHPVLITPADPYCDPQLEVGHGDRAAYAELVGLDGGAVAG